MDHHTDVTNSKSANKTAPNPDPSHVAIWIALNRARGALMRQVDKTLRDKGLPPLTWYDVLWSIEQRGGVARPAEIIEDLLFEPSALSHMLRRIEAAGLLRASIVNEDRRGRVFQITPEGKVARTTIWQIYGAELEKHLAPLGQLFDPYAVAKALEKVADPSLD
ncbi:MAG: MarR family transcriptional regulator [Tateyamaria sp.]|uniref:MarR family winged helix-turn-helix transcriptional regulator n=1 Tax=Tateyamaria sp. TaxID=1929288 RepID=UPI0032A0C047